jgi:hypothetical protein
MILREHHARSAQEVVIYHAWGYALVYTDARSFVMLRRTPEMEAFIRGLMEVPTAPCLDDVPSRTR